MVHLCKIVNRNRERMRKIFFHRSSTLSNVIVYKTNLYYLNIQYNSPISILFLKFCVKQ